MAAHNNKAAILTRSIAAIRREELAPTSRMPPRYRGAHPGPRTFPEQPISSLPPLLGRVHIFSIRLLYESNCDSIRGTLMRTGPSSFSVSHSATRPTSSQLFLFQPIFIIGGERFAHGQFFAA